MQKFYRERLASYEARKSEIVSALSKLHIVRLLTFLAFVVTLFFTFKDGFVVAHFSLSFTMLLLFINAVNHDNALSKELKRVECAINIYNCEIDSLKFNFNSSDKGERYVDINRHLACDFDLFGDRSLFDYLLRSVTKGGVDKFAKSLVTPIFDSESINQRREAIEELSLKPEFIEKFRIAGAMLDEKGDEIDRLIEFTNDNSSEIKLLNFCCFLLPVINIAAVVLSIVGVLPGSLLSLPVGISLFVVYSNYKLFNSVSDKVGRSSQIFTSYAELISTIESTEFSSLLLKGCKAKIVSNGVSQSRSILKLKSIVESFDVRNNMLAAAILNSLLLYELQCYRRLLAWKRANRDSIEPLFDAITTVDSLLGYAIYGANCRKFTTLAECGQSKFEIVGVDMVHPLIPPSEGVENSINISHQPSTLVVTGANMAGKSTYLRTVVVNLILATNGARVRAASFRFTPCQILSSIKIQDSLSDKESYFYAELKRLKFILDQLKSEPRSLVILDEMLRGTNSRDKQLGSIGCIENILRCGGAAIVATHDLAIGDMDKTYPDLISNSCFEVGLHDNKLMFDYKLKEGVTTKLNASHLMREMGIIN